MEIENKVRLPNLEELRKPMTGAAPYLKMRLLQMETRLSKVTPIIPGSISSTRSS